MRTYLFAVMFVVFLAISMAAMAVSAVSGGTIGQRLVEHTQQQTTP